MRLLFTPLKINGVEIPNRVVMPAFGLKYCGLDRKPNERLVAFYEARARGGCGLLIVGGVGIDLGGSGMMLPTIEADDFVESWQHLAAAVHRHGSRLFLQLFHSGRYQHSVMARGKQAVAPSAIPSRYTKETPRALEVAEIHDIQEKFAAAAVRARKAGADGVELISSAGYLVCQFLSPITNERTDEYGGNFANRCRFGTEMIEKVRAAVGPDYPICIRMSGSEFMPGGNTNTDVVEICRVFESAGADAFNVTGGWHETRVPQLPTMVPRGAFTYLAARIRRGVSVPVFASNRIVNPTQAEEILRDSSADMVCIGRSQIADPEWVNKARSGDFDAIRPCVACLQGCMDRLFSVRDVQCLCNPEAGFEAKRILQAAKTPLKVLVIGAGPAGLEAAVTAAKRGHVVHLFDQAFDIGGQLPLAAAPPGREEFASLLHFYRSRLLALNIHLGLGKEVTMATVRKLAPDRVILATGSRQTMPAMHGLELAHVVSAWDALSGKAVLGERVVVLGGGAVGVETAISIADKGTINGETLKFLMKHGAETIESLQELIVTGNKKVTILEMLPKIGSGIGPSTKWVFLKELEMLGVDTFAGATVTRIDAQGVSYEQDGKINTVAADTVVVALGSSSQDDLSVELRAAGFDVLLAGDVKKPRTILEAVHEGYLAGASV